MLINIKFKNFYSFANESQVSMVVNKNAPDTNSYLSDSNFRCNKMLGVLGANGSGKTCLLRVVPFLSWFLNNSFSLKPEDDIPVKPFVLNRTGHQKPAEMTVTFMIKDKIYSYEVRLTANKVLFEELKHKTSSGFRTLFTREFFEKDKKYVFSLNNFDLDKDFELLMQKRHNASVLSTANQFNHELSNQILSFWKNIHNINISEEGKIRSDSMYSAARYYSKNKNTMNKVVKILQKMDLGLSGIKIEESKSKDGKEFYLPYGVHLTRESDSINLPMLYESSGTQNLFILLGRVVEALEEGGVVIFDEIDSDLHPKMVLYILELFKSERTNKTNAQIIFSTHALLLLEKLDKYQIQFTEKNKYGESKTWRLDEMPGIRHDDNFLIKYLRNEYGALPKID